MTPERSAPAQDLDLRSPEIVRSWADGAEEVLVLSPTGLLDGDCVRELEEILRLRPQIPMIVDFDHCMITNTRLLRRLDPDRWDRPMASVCVVCSRVTARELMGRSGLAQRLEVFQRTADALQARLLEGAGYGSGWGAATDGRTRPAVR